MRLYRLAYRQAPRLRTSLLESMRVSGHRFDNGVMEEASLAPLTFHYTEFAPEAQSIAKFQSNTVPPPALDEDTTLLDYKGAAMPGILRMNGIEATFWENRGSMNWGPPQRLAALPQGLQLGADEVRFADLTGNGTADLVVARALGGGYYPHSPETGFERKRSTMLAPSFDLGEDGFLVDLDGDRVSDFLTFRNGQPLAFFNDRGQSWSGPVVLALDHVGELGTARRRVRFADMNGDGQADLVVLRSRRVVYYPGLGNGKWGAARPIANTPEFTVPDVDADVFLADIDGDGSADLILFGAGEIRIYLNAGGESFADPIVLDRTPRLGISQFLLADMAGSGTVGFLWTSEGSAARPHEYWYLDPLNGRKPYLLAEIDNGTGLRTRIDYSTSVRERTRDLAEGRRWTGYLPFAVHVVARLTHQDSVTGQNRVTSYRYHDGHYDGRSREYLGFASVDALQQATAQEAAVHHRYSFHNRAANGDDPGFLAGKGQPRRTELLDPATGEVRQVEEAVWQALPVATADAARPAYLGVEAERSSRRIADGVPYEQEHLAFTYDAAGNQTLEARTSQWSDRDGIAHSDDLTIETRYAAHAVHGVTDFKSRVRKTSGGRVLKDIAFFYDGPAFQGLPAGQVENGFRVRQTEVTLTQQEIDDAYGGVAPALLASLYRAANDPELGPVWVKDLFRYRVDAFGNQVETIDAVGHQVAITYDGNGIHPTSLAEDGGPGHAVQFDIVAQQLAFMEDLNGNGIRTRYDALGNVLEVYRRGAVAGQPTETYRYIRDAVPNAVIQQVRLLPDDAAPGYEKREYRDGAGKICQEKLRTETGRWAVGRATLYNTAGKELGERDAWFSDTPAFEASPPAGTAQKLRFFDFAGRVTSEQLYSGAQTVYRYERNITRFWAPDRAAALALDPSTAPSRVSRADARGNVVSLEEHDGAGVYAEARTYDGLSNLIRIADCRGNIALDSTTDLWGNRIRVLSAEAGVTTWIYDGNNQEVMRTDADGRSVYTPRDRRGRITEVRRDGPGGPLEEQYAYDTGAGANLAGRLARVTGDFGTVDYSYSVDGDPVSIRRRFAGHPTPYEIGFTYDHQRNVRSVTYPDATSVDYDYYANGMLRAIPGYIDRVEYGPTGKRTRILFANGLETRRGYTAGEYLLNELLTQPATGGAKLQHLVHHLDEMGRVTRIDDLSTVAGKVRNNQTLVYDLRNRLIRATGRGATGDYDFAYRYDDLGNLVYSDELFAEDVQYGVQLGDTAHPNRLLKRQSAGAVEYHYDASGNLLADPDLGQLTYDARHRLVRVDRPNGATVEYRYDHNGRRTESRLTDHGVTTVRYEVEGLYLVGDSGPVKIVFDDDRRLAIVPAAGDPLLHHLDRLGNVNVVSNLNTGAFTGHDEYTPYGRLSVSIVILPHFSFQGAEFSDGLDVVLLGARFYRPWLGRFLTPDRYLIENQERIPGILAASNLYLYALANPVNFTDPTGQIAFLIVLLIAVVVGAALGAIGAWANGAQTWDEWLLWIVGGAIGAALAVLTGGALALAFGGSAAVGGIVALIIWGSASLLGSIFTPILDNTNSPVAWFFSFLLKWIQSPITTTIGLIAALVVAIAGGRVDFRRGMLFIEVGPGGGALTLGAVAWTQSGRFDASGQVPDNLARHESFHSRTVAAIGELGFYFTYVTVGAIWGAAQGGPWNDLNGAGCGNPFEKTAHTFTGDPAVAVSASSC